MELIVSYLPLFGVVALAFVFIKNAWVGKQDVGDEKMARIAKNIADGAMSFLKAEYKILSIFVIAVAILLYFKGTLENVSSVQFAGGEIEVMLDVKQPNSDETREGITVSNESEIELDQNQATVNFAMRWDGSKSQSTLDILTPGDLEMLQKAVSEDDDGKKVPLLGFECRGLEPIKYYMASFCLSDRK